MDYLQIALVVLAVVGVWAIVEVALTLRTTSVSKAASDAVTGVVESVSKLGTGLGGSLNPSKLAEVAQARLSGATATAQQSAQRAQEYLEELPLLSQDKTKHSRPARSEQFYIEYGSESSQKTEE